MKKINLDNAATVKPKQQVINYAIEIMTNNWENPNSIYDNGIKARKIIENARNIIADKINAKPEEIIFCPSASSANSLAILGYLRKNRSSKFITSNIEHDSILKIEMPIHVKKEILECDEKGFISPILLNDFSNNLISIGGANSEIGTIQDIKLLAKVAHENNCIFHSDLTQYIPYLPVDVKELELDMATFSAHKLGGLRGCAVLYVKNGIQLEPLVYGHQEQGLMAGTENTIAIGSMGKAMELLEYDNEILRLRNYLLWNLIAIDNKITINGCIFNRLPNNLNICIHDLNISNQKLIALLDMYGIQVSAASACQAGSNKPSSVLKAIGLSKSDINHSMRITLGQKTTIDELNIFIECLKNIIEMNKI